MPDLSTRDGKKQREHPVKAISLLRNEILIFALYTHIRRALDTRFGRIVLLDVVFTLI